MGHSWGTRSHRSDPRKGAGGPDRVPAETTRASTLGSWGSPGHGRMFLWALEVGGEEVGEDALAHVACSVPHLEQPGTLFLRQVGSASLPSSAARTCSLEGRRVRALLSFLSRVFSDVGRPVPGCGAHCGRWRVMADGPFCGFRPSRSRSSARCSVRTSFYGASADSRHPQLQNSGNQSRPACGVQTRRPLATTGQPAGSVVPSLSRAR